MARNTARVVPRGLRAAAVAVCAAIGLSAAGCDASGPPAVRPWKEQAAVIPAVPPGTGNGVAALAPADIVHAALAATGTAPSVHVQGAVVAGGTTSSIDMRYDQTGGSGTIVTGGTTVQVTRIQSDVWLSGAADFWSAAGAIDGGRSFAGKYLQLPVADASDTPLIDLTRVSGLLDRLLRGTGPYVAGPVGTVGGMPAISVLDQTKGYGGQIWVATQGQPYVLRIDAAPGSPVTGSVSLTGYGDDYALAPPDPALVLTPAAIARNVRAPIREGKRDGGGGWSITSGRKTGE